MPFRISRAPDPNAARRRDAPLAFTAADLAAYERGIAREAELVRAYVAYMTLVAVNG